MHQYVLNELIVFYQISIIHKKIKYFYSDINFYILSIEFEYNHRINVLYPLNTYNNGL